MWNRGHIDVTLVATRRPDLLEPTLRTFSQHLLSRLPVRKLFVNLDPVWGDQAADREVERICKFYIHDVIFRRPEEPGFGAAVKWLWSQPETEWFLHLEDDWLLLRPVDLDRLNREMGAAAVAQISLSRINRRAWRRGVWVSQFSTSPSFVKTSFAKLVSSLQNPALDPEKQMYGTGNQALVEAIKGKFHHRLHGHRFASDYVSDIGRSWRDKHGITKQIVNERSVWLPAKHD